MEVFNGQVTIELPEGYEPWDIKRARSWGRFRIPDIAAVEQQRSGCSQPACFLTRPELQEHPQ